jgi:hypothetical protein
MAIHKGTELNNVNETWNENERLRAAGDAPGTDNTAGHPANESEELKQAIKEEAAEYDKANKEDRLLDGERATVNDNPRGDSGDA